MKTMIKILIGKLQQRPQQLYILVLLCFLNGCGGENYEYKGEDGNIQQAMTVPVGATTGNFEFTIVTNLAYPIFESEYPTISAD